MPTTKRTTSTKNAPAKRTTRASHGLRSCQRIIHGARAWARAYAARNHRTEPTGTAMASARSGSMPSNRTVVRAAVRTMKSGSAGSARRRKRVRTNVEADSPRRWADSQPTLAAKPPTTKNIGMISAIQVAGANQRSPETGLTMKGEPSGLRPTPTSRRWTNTTTSTQTTRARSRVRSRWRGIEVVT